MNFKHENETVLVSEGLTGYCGGGEPALLYGRVCLRLIGSLQREQRGAEGVRPGQLG